MNPRIAELYGLTPDSDLRPHLRQVAHRARAYQLENNGAENPAHARRRAKNAIAYYRNQIRYLHKRQDGPAALPPEELEARISALESGIQAKQEEIRLSRPAARLIAPVARRVAREDRRRRKAAKNR